MVDWLEQSEISVTFGWSNVRDADLVKRVNDQKKIWEHWTNGQ